MNRLVVCAVSLRLVCKPELVSAISLVRQWFGMAATFFVSSRFGWVIGEGRRSDSEGGEQGRPQEVAERPSQTPNGSARQLPRSSSRNEHARSRAGSMGFGGRGDAARRACWFRR